MRFLVFLLAGWSGFFVMAVEMLSARILAPYFGNSVYVWGGIITVYMLALSAGYLLGGKFSTRSPSLFKLIAILLVATLTTVPIVVVGEGVLNTVSNWIDDPRYGTLAACLGLFFIPTVFCGMVSPYAIRLLVDEHLLSGHFAGRLYFVSTLGSALGTLLTSFYFVLYWEVNQILWGLLAFSMLVICSAYGWRKMHEKNIH